MEDLRRVDPGHLGSWGNPLSCACWRHVADMSPTADNVGEIRPTGPVGDIDIFFFFVPAQKNVGKCRHFINTHNSTPLKLSTSKLNLIIMAH